MEQFELNFEAPAAEERLAKLKSDYLTKVGVPARTNDPDKIEVALENPEAERERLRAHDRDEDRTDLRNTYRRG